MPLTLANGADTQVGRLPLQRMERLGGMTIFTISVKDAADGQRHLDEMRRQEVEAATGEIVDPEVRQREAELVGRQFDLKVNRPL